MPSIKKSASLVFAAVALATTASHAVLSWPGCTDVANTEFKVVPIVSRTPDMANEPMKMAFDLLAAPTEDAKGKVDVYFTERLGNIRKYDSKTAKVITLGTLTLNIDVLNSSDGALGIALDPAFKSNHHLYIYYTYVTTAEKNWRVSRFTLNAAHDKLDMASEIPVIKIPIRSGSKHPGGAIQFDAYGDLWITTGNDYITGKDFPVWSSANTNDLRGKILRIHPTADGKYTIPEGNLFKPGEALTKPEIYIMGSRNPYTLTLDPVRRWALWGDVGPDTKDMDGNPMNGDGATEKTEEYDLATGPGNYGYPFWAGNYMTKSGMNAAAPVIPENSDWAGVTPGLMTLPKYIAPIYSYRKACAITGPLYRYDGDLNSSIKFPPHFQRKWLVSDFNGDNNRLVAFTVSEDGKNFVSEERVLTSAPLHAPVDIQTGPDGALYVVNYAGYRDFTPNTGLVRIEYTGNCRPLEPKIEKPGSVDVILAKGEKYFKGPRVDVSQSQGLKVAVNTASAFSLEVRDLMGRPVAAREGKGSTPVDLDEVSQSGVYFLRVKTAEGLQVIKVAKD
jgi:glucose/arabinose dehydrogenase